MSSAVDPAHPANATLVAACASESAPLRDGEAATWALDGWYLRTHPDLVERVEVIGRDLDGVRFGGLLGRPCLAVPPGIVVAIGEGTGQLSLRLGSAAQGIVQHPFRPRPDLGEEWVAVDAWLSDVPGPIGLELERAWVTEAAARLTAA